MSTFLEWVRAQINNRSLTMLNLLIGLAPREGKKFFRFPFFFFAFKRILYALCVPWCALFLDAVNIFSLCLSKKR